MMETPDRYESETALDVECLLGREMDLAVAGRMATFDDDLVQGCTLVLRDDRPRIGLNRSEIVAVHGAPPNLARCPGVYNRPSAPAPQPLRRAVVLTLSPDWSTRRNTSLRDISVPQQSTGTRRRPHQYMIMPPSTLMACPVMLAASSDAR